jgi:hypothetical protein
MLWLLKITKTKPGILARQERFTSCLAREQSDGDSMVQGSWLVSSLWVLPLVLDGIPRQLARFQIRK